MGKVVKTVLKVAAVAAIAYFAPPLAASIGSSIGVSGALATTALSGAIGAGVGELAGVGWQSGAFVGGLAGAGQSGLFGGKAAGAAGSAGGGTATPAAGTAGAAPAAGTAGAAPAAGTAGAAPAAAAAPSSIGDALSGAAAKPTSVLTQGLKNVQAGVGGALGAVGLGGLATSGTLGAVAPSLLAMGLAGNPGAGMAKAQEAELARAQQVNAALTQQRLDQANQLIGDTSYIDPEYMARQAAEDAMIRGGIQTAERTRGLTGERLAAERRRMALGTSRTAGSAYQQGFGTGVDARVRTRAAGISAIPTAFPMADSSGALNATNAADRRQAEQQAGLSRLFGQALGQRPTPAQLAPSVADAIAGNPALF